MTIIRTKQGPATSTYSVERVMPTVTDDELIAICDNFGYNFGGRVTRHADGSATVVVYTD